MDLSNENVIHVNKNGVQYLQFRRLLEYSNVINHAYTLRTDIDYRIVGVDQNPLPDEKYNKNLVNYKDICECLNTDYMNIIQPMQKHTKTVKNVEKNDRNPYFSKMDYPDTDGLITNKKNIMLSTTNADCILLMFFDPVKKVISNVHSGWKGTLQEISVEAVKKMIKDYDCNPEDIICCICPSIRKCHFEVDEDVKNLFYEQFKKLEQCCQENRPSGNIIEYDETKGRWHIDTVLINREILKNVGLKDENIIDCGICSVCNSDMVHSFRVEKEGYGLETALIELK